MCQTLAEGGRRCSQKSMYAKSANNLKAQKQYHARIAADPNTTKAQRTKSEAAIAQTEKELAKLATAHDEFGSEVFAFDMPVTKVTEKVLNQLEADGLTPFVVGGSIRDKLLGLGSKDMDIEVYGGDTQKVIKSLRKLGNVDEVGKAFGVLKMTLDGEDLDISLPRTDSKVGDDHRGFEVSVDPHMTPAEAAQRRDYTINSMLYSHSHRAVIDPYNGRQDLRDGILRHVSDAFDEDPLRVLRGVQMASRFNMVLHPDTIVKAETLKDQFNTLATERVGIEFEKLYTKGKNTAKAFQVLKQTGWDKNFPGLAEVNDDKLQASLTRAQDIITRDKVQGEEKEVFLSAVVASTIGGKNAESFIQTTMVGDKPKAISRKLMVAQVPDVNNSKELRYWAKDFNGVRVRDWAKVQEALGNKKVAATVLAKAEKLGIADDYEPPFVQGRDVLANYPNVKTGPWLGHLLRDALDEQYSDKIRTHDSGVAWLKQNISKYVTV
jgi:tRNA nucleotidyltransferase/poly(A) polymerase